MHSHPFINQSVEQGSSPGRTALALLNGSRAARSGRRTLAFTLIEMLLVIAIIGVVIAISLPSMKGLTRANSIASANRQLLDDIALARQRAILGRTTVHIVFVPPLITNTAIMVFNTADPKDLKLAATLMNGQFTTYALFAERAVGDQPGQPHFGYVSQWKTLPDGVFISDREFNYMERTDWAQFSNPTNWPFEYIKIPFPSSNGLSNTVPHIAFDPQGRLFRLDASGNRVFPDEVIELARGSILSQRDNVGNLISFDVRESPLNNSVLNFNHIVIDGSTGRAKVDRPKIE